MLTDEVIARLVAEVPAFISVEGAAELAAVMKGGRAPNRMPAAFVLSAGLRARPADAAAGVFRQAVSEMTGVLIVAGVAGDARGGAAAARAETLCGQVVAALAGWTPEGEQIIGPMELTSAELLGLEAGVVSYQVNFSTAQQLRIQR